MKFLRYYFNNPITMLHSSSDAIDTTLKGALALIMASFIAIIVSSSFITMAMPVVMLRALFLLIIFYVLLTFKFGSCES